MVRLSHHRHPGPAKAGDVLPAGTPFKLTSAAVLADGARAPAATSSDAQVGEEEGSVAGGLIGGVSF
jgi:hypothetical protein